MYIWNILCAIKNMTIAEFKDFILKTVLGELNVIKKTFIIQ